MESDNVDATAAQTSVVKCGMCKHNVGLYFCQDCSTPICETCRKIHRNLPMVASHSVINLKDVNRSIYSLPYCSTHNQQYVFYCELCETLICNNCEKNDHRGHHIAEIKPTVDQLRKLATKKVSQMSTNLKDLFTKIENIETVELPRCEKESQDVVSRLNSTVTDIKNFITEKKELAISTIFTENNIQIRNIKNDLEIKKEIYQRQLNVCKGVENHLTEKNDIKFYVDFDNWQRNVKESDNDAMDDFVQPAVPVFNPTTFLDGIVGDMILKFSLSRENQKRVSDQKQTIVSQLEKQQADLEDQIKELQKRLADQELKVKQKDKTIAELQIVEEAKKKEIADLKKSLLDHKQSLKTQQQLNGENQKRIGELERRLTQEQSNTMKRHKESNELMKKNSELKREITDIKKRLENEYLTIKQKDWKVKELPMETKSKEKELQIFQTRQIGDVTATCSKPELHSDSEIRTDDNSAADQISEGYECKGAQGLAIGERKKLGRKRSNLKEPSNNN